MMIDSGAVSIAPRNSPNVPSYINDLHYYRLKVAFTFCEKFFVQYAKVPVHYYFQM